MLTIFLIAFVSIFGGVAGWLLLQWGSEDNDPVCSIIGVLCLITFPPILPALFIASFIGS